MVVDRLNEDGFCFVWLCFTMTDVCQSNPWLSSDFRLALNFRSHGWCDMKPGLPSRVNYSSFHSSNLVTMYENIICFFFFSFFSSLELSQKNNQGTLHRIRLQDLDIPWLCCDLLDPWTQFWKSIIHLNARFIHTYIHLYIHLTNPKQTVVIIFTFAYALFLHGRLQNKLFLATIPSEVDFVW